MTVLTPFTTAGPPPHTYAARSFLRQCSVSDAAAFKAIGVTPMIGKNDDQGTFSQSDARDLVAFATANRLGLVSFWEANRDRNACTGALFQCTNVPQTPFEFSRIFATFAG